MSAVFGRKKVRKMEKFSINQIPAVLYGAPAGRVFLHVHGRLGCKEEGERLADIVCPKGYQVLSIDLPGHGERRTEMDRFVPWEVVPELESLYSWAAKRWKKVFLYANSIGAYFSLLAFADKQLEKALLVSPVLDMEKLIRNMMLWARVTEQQLERQGEIPTAFGETLSWRYLGYAKENPVTRWEIPTSILYAGKDTLTERATVDAFARRFGCGLRIMEEGEHWFHTEEQLAVLDQWTAGEV